MYQFDEDIFCLNKGDRFDVFQVCHGVSTLVFSAATLDECYEWYWYLS